MKGAGKFLLNMLVYKQLEYFLNGNARIETQRVTYARRRHEIANFYQLYIFSIWFKIVRRTVKRYHSRFNIILLCFIDI